MRQSSVSIGISGSAARTTSARKVIWGTIAPPNMSFNRIMSVTSAKLGCGVCVTMSASGFADFAAA